MERCFVIAAETPPTWTAAGSIMNVLFPAAAAAMR